MLLAGDTPLVAAPSRYSSIPMSIEVRMSMDEARLLLASWLLRLAREAGYPLGQQGWTSAGVVTLGSPTEFHLIVEPLEQYPWVKVRASDVREQPRIDDLAPAAASRVDAMDIGGDVWYSTRFETQRPEGRMLMEQLQRLLSDGVRIRGWRRLGHSVLLEFGGNNSDGDIPAEFELGQRATI